MSAETTPPALVVVVGPPAVGKMTVGHEIARRTGLRLFHNHHTIDLDADWLRIDNTTVSAADVAERVIAHFGLPRLDADASPTAPTA